MKTGFHNITKEELCREWNTIMENTTTVDDLTSSIRFLRICQELDCRKITPMQIAKILISTIDMKTKEGWDNSSLSLNEFLAVGDKVDEVMADYFLGVLPPACMSSRCIQIGEPWTHDSNGNPMFETLTKADKDSPWVYAGILVTPDSEQCLY